VAVPLGAVIPLSLRRRLSPAKRALLRLKTRAAGWLARGGQAREYNYVFVVTYGRSGSTLLMGLLNAIPGYRILGENGNALYRLFQAYAAIAAAHEKFPGALHQDPRSAWYGAPRLRPERFRADLVESFVATVLRPEPGDRVLGFKEVRYTVEHMPDLADFLAFLPECFPNCKIVFNHRQAAATAKSGWWPTIGDAERKIRAASDRFLTFPADDRHFHFWYDEIDDSLANVHALLAFLGETLSDVAIREVLGTTHAEITTKV
jgi:hypothetical protein